MNGESHNAIAPELMLTNVLIQQRVLAPIDSFGKLEQ